MGYKLEGRLLEVCDCNVLCPCWVGEDPDGDTCEAINAWHIDKGTIEGVDVSGLTLGLVIHIPGNILEGNWRVAIYIPERATQEQEEALVKVWTGKLGGPVADLGGLVGEVVAVERVPIIFNVEAGQGTVKFGDVAEAELAPFQGATGKSTTLLDTAFSTIPGSPAFVGKASRYRREVAQHGFKPVNLQSHNAIQGNFRFEA